MKSIGLYFVLSWLMGSSVGRLLLLAAALWYLDNRYLGLLSALWAPVRRAQRIASLRQSVEQNPSDIRAMVELGEHYLQSGKYTVAAEYLERAMDRGEDSARALFLQGAAWVKLGRHAEGRAKLREALEKQPQVGYGEPYIYLLEEALVTWSPTSPEIDALVRELSHFESVGILTRAGRLCAAAGRKDLAQTLFGEAIHNYGFIPKKMRGRERRWLIWARLGLMQVK